MRVGEWTKLGLYSQEGGSFAATVYRLVEIAMQKMNQRRQFGQGMTEYIIIVALIAIAAITVYNLFGDTVRGQVGDMASELGGGDSTGEGAAAGGDAATEAAAEYDLSDFNQTE